MQSVLVPTQKVSEVVLDHSECAAVFARHNIDYCCKGNVTLLEAAAAHGMGITQLVAELNAEIAARGDGVRVDLRAYSTPRLCAYIVTKHHEFLRQTLPLVRELAQKVNRVHGSKVPSLGELESAVLKLVETLLAHIDEEEHTLFPQMVVGQVSPAMLDAIMEEHFATGALLHRIRLAAADFVLPTWACPSYRTLFAELQAIEKDTFRHVHLENSVLMPRFFGR